MPSKSSPLKFISFDVLVVTSNVKTLPLSYAITQSLSIHDIADGSPVFKLITFIGLIKSEDENRIMLNINNFIIINF